MSRLRRAMPACAGAMILAGAMAGGDRETVTFSEVELARIEQMSPLPDPPPDPTNRVADDAAAAQLGQFLFFDKRLSGAGDVACATCHDPKQAFTDGKVLAEGAGTGLRNAPSLLNAAYQRWLFWDGRADSLWAQALQPIERDFEMNGDRVHAVMLLRDDPALRRAYEEVFGPMPEVVLDQTLPPHAKPVDGAPDHLLAVAWQALSKTQRDAINTVYANLGKAIEAYERRLVSRRSAFDAFVAALEQDGPEASRALLSPSAQRGLKLFIGKANCRVCHHGPLLSDGEFHNTGAPPNPDVASPDTGRYGGVRKLKADVFRAGGPYSDSRERGSSGAGGSPIDPAASLRTGPDLWGQFKTPSLRNVALTAPYMHQGQFATLRDVLRFYSTRDGAVTAGHHQEQILQPLNLTQREIDDLIAFLESLTDVSIDPRLLEPPESPLAGGD